MIFINDHAHRAEPDWSFSAVAGELPPWWRSLAQAGSRERWGRRAGRQLVTRVGYFPREVLIAPARNLRLLSIEEGVQEAWKLAAWWNGLLAVVATHFLELPIDLQCLGFRFCNSSQLLVNIRLENLMSSKVVILAEHVEYARPIRSVNGNTGPDGLELLHGVARGGRPQPAFTVGGTIWLGWREPSFVRAWVWRARAGILEAPGTSLEVGNGIPLDGHLLVPFLVYPLLNSVGPLMVISAHFWFSSFQDITYIYVNKTNRTIRNWMFTRYNASTCAVSLYFLINFPEIVRGIFLKNCKDDLASPSSSSRFITTTNTNMRVFYDIK